MNKSQFAITLAGIGVTAAMAITVTRPVDATVGHRTFQHRLSAEDRHFIKETAQDQQGDIAMGRLARERGASESVRAFGRRQIVDHTRTFADLQRTADRLGYPPPDEPGEKQRSMMRELGRRHGVAFDRLYRRDMIQDHVNDVETFRRQVRDSHSPAIRRYAERTLPVLREHLQMAMAMATQPRAYAHRRYRDR